jgi:hypothetical protein
MTWAILLVCLPITQRGVAFRVDATSFSLNARDKIKSSILLEPCLERAL